MSRLPVLRWLWLVVAWVALWGDATPANLLAGAAVATGLLVVFPPDRRPRATVRPLAALRFAGWFLWKLVEASVVVAWEVATPRNRIREGVIAVPLRGITPELTTFVANAISLTPGTLTLEVRTGPPTVLYVHVLHLHDVDAARREVRHLERLAARAFAPAAALGDTAGDDADAAGIAEPSQSTKAATEDR